jgi:O-antigen/teichoic acid export membrane protein
MTPIIVRALGNYDYGIWEIVLAIIGYMGILDFGLQPAITKYVAQYNAIENKAKLNEIYCSSLPLMASGGMLCFIVFLTIGLLSQTRIEQNVTHETRYMLFFFILGVQLLIVFPGYVFQSFHHGFQRYHLCNLVSIATITGGNALLYVLMKKGGGLLTLVSMTASMAYVRYLAYWVLLRRKRFGGYRFRRDHFCWDTVRELASFGMKIVAGGIAARISSYIDTVLIGMFLGPVMVTFYAIPRNLVQIAFNIVPAVTQSFMPLFSDLNARSQKTDTEEVYLIASRYMLAIIVLFGIQLYFLGVPFLARWIGAEYAEKGRIVLYVLLFAKLFAVSPFQARYLTATGRQMVFVKFAWIMTVANAGLSLVLLQFIGIEGVAIGATASVVIVYPFVFRISCRYIGVTVPLYLKNVVLPLILPSISLVGALWGLSSVILTQDYLGMFTTAALSSMLFALTYFLFGVPETERAVLVRKVQGCIAPHKGVSKT